MPAKYHKGEYTFTCSDGSKLTLSRDELKLVAQEAVSVLAEDDILDFIDSQLMTLPMDEDVERGAFSGQAFRERLRELKERIDADPAVLVRIAHRLALLRLDSNTDEAAYFYAIDDEVNDYSDFE